LHVADDVDLDTLGTWLRPDRSFSKPETIIRVVPPPNNDPSSHPSVVSPEIREMRAVLSNPFQDRMEYNLLLHVAISADLSPYGFKGICSCGWHGEREMPPSTSDHTPRITSCKSRVFHLLEHRIRAPAIEGKLFCCTS
jgi:hypothetical protein